MKIALLTIIFATIASPAFANSYRTYHVSDHTVESVFTYQLRNVRAYVGLGYSD